MAGRFIKLYDKILNWEWYQHPNTLCLFIHLLLKANYKDTSFQGHVIRRGQLVTSITRLSTSTGLTFQQTRTALEHLQSTGEITSESRLQCRVITVLKYDDYQSATSGTAGEQQAINTQSNKPSTSRATSGATPCIEYIESQNDRNIDPPTVERRSTRFTPPTQEEIEAFCREQGLSVDAGRFIDYYSANGWMIGRSHMKDWKATVRNWARRDQERPRPQQQAPVQPKKTVVAQQYEQRSYATEDEDAFQRMLRMGGY